MELHAAQESLLRIVGLQMVGYVVLEVIFAFLVFAGILPPTLTTAIDGNVIVQINTGWIMICGLVAVLLASFWSAVLIEFEFVKPEHKRFKH